MKSEHDPAFDPAGDDSLSWLAFRYVAGELSPDEQATFEARLDVDQLAREAVAREVELSQAVAIAAAPSRAISPAASVPAPALSRRTLISWFAAAAASLAIGLVLGRGLNEWNGPQGETARLSPADAAAAHELAGYWEPAGEPSNAEALNTESSNTEHAAATGREVLASSEDEGAVPSWLLAALEPEEPADAPQEN